MTDLPPLSVLVVILLSLIGSSASVTAGQRLRANPASWHDDPLFRRAEGWILQLSMLSASVSGTLISLSPDKFGDKIMVAVVCAVVNCIFNLHTVSAYAGPDYKRHRILCHLVWISLSCMTSVVACSRY